jgi:hypothetical protein
MAASAPTLQIVLGPMFSVRLFSIQCATSSLARLLQLTFLFPYPVVGSAPKLSNCRAKQAKCFAACAATSMRGAACWLLSTRATRATAPPVRCPRTTAWSCPRFVLRAPTSRPTHRPPHCFNGPRLSPPPHTHTHAGVRTRAATFVRQRAVPGVHSGRSGRGAVFSGPPRVLRRCPCKWKDGARGGAGR